MSEIYRLWEWAIVDRIKEETIHLSRYSLINRQSERDRRCLRKLEELSQSVWRTSFNNNKVKELIYFRYDQVF